MFNCISLSLQFSRTTINGSFLSNSNQNCVSFLTYCAVTEMIHEKTQNLYCYFSAKSLLHEKSGHYLEKKKEKEPQETKIF